MFAQRARLTIACSLGAALVACSDGPSQGETEGTDEDATSAFATKFVYTCTAERVDARYEAFQLTLEGDAARFVDLSTRAESPRIGRRDVAYRAPASNRSALRFNSFGSPVLGDITLDGTLRLGKAGRVVVKTGRGEATKADAFSCTRRDLELAPRRSVPLRLLCTVNDGCDQATPPRCLTRTTINEGIDGAAELFAVWEVATEVQNDTRGTSLSFGRDTSSASGQWAGASVQLAYRDGITYYGKLSLDGQTFTVQCNDTAMWRR